MGRREVMDSFRNCLPRIKDLIIGEYASVGEYNSEECETWYPQDFAMMFTCAEWEISIGIHAGSPEYVSVVNVLDPSRINNEEEELLKDECPDLHDADSMVEAEYSWCADERYSY